MNGILTWQLVSKMKVFYFHTGRRSGEMHKTETDQLFKDAISYYQQVSKEYLNQTISVVGTSGADLISVPRKFLFLYPDYRVPFHPFEPRIYFTVL